MGPIRLNLTFPHVREMCTDARDTIAGNGARGLAITAGRGIILVVPDILPTVSPEARSQYLSEIRVLTPDLRTSDGLGVGSYVADIVRRSRRIDATYCDGRLSSISSASRPEVVFHVQECVGRAAGRTGVSQDDLRLQVSAVVVADIID